MSFSFDIFRNDKNTKARAGIIHTNHGEVPTPVFCPVGTQATVKTLSAIDIEQIGAPMILNNAYHLYLRPGLEILKKFNGIHNFQSWKGAITTDSGGFQVFSLGGLRKISEEGVKFQSPYDGSYHFITPERSVEMQLLMGSDIMMSFDECLKYPAEKSDTRKSMEITLKWEKRGKDYWDTYSSQNDFFGALYGIGQGGFYADLRREFIERMIPMDFPGYAVGGLSVGEPKASMFEMVDLSTDLLPNDKPRHLLGVGTPLDILRGVELGMDTFDCVIPTRNARNGSVYTWNGKFSVKAGAYKDDDSPIDSNCNCYTCRNFSRGYIRHLFRAGELLAPRLATIHSIHFYIEFMNKMRNSILNGNFSEFSRQFRSSFSDKMHTPEIKK